MSRAGKRSPSRWGATARTIACASSSGFEVLRGRRKSIPCAAANSSMATIIAVLPAMSPRRRAAKVAIETWSSWFAEVGSESTLAGCARDLFSEASAAAVTCAIMKPEFTPLAAVRKGGRPESEASMRSAMRRSESAPISAIASASWLAAKAVRILHLVVAGEVRGADGAAVEELAIDLGDENLSGLAAQLVEAMIERRVAAHRRVHGHCARDRGRREDVPCRAQPVQR